MSLGSDLWVRFSVTETPFADLTDVTLADEDTDSIPTEHAKRTIKGNVAMHVMQPGGQLWPNLELMQVVPSGAGCGEYSDI